MKKQILFTILMLISLVAMADDSGTCGENLTWTYTEATKILTISGTGEMTDYRSSDNTPPWNSYSQKIVKVSIGNGVKSIGNFAFGSCYNLTSVTIGNSVTSIGEHAFSNCYRLSRIDVLATEPPYITGSYTFYVNGNNDEIYQYVYVHIPKGTYEAYSSAYGWRRFERFKEDMTINGIPYYVKLNVTDSNNGYVEQYVKIDESYTVSFGKKRRAIKKVEFNGEEVTEQIKDNTYTTPVLKEDSRIKIEYDEIESDINGDGVVDTQDVLDIYKYIQEH